MPKTYNPTTDRRRLEARYVRQLWTDRTRDNVRELACFIHFNDPQRTIHSAKHAACCLLGIEPEGTR